MLTATFTRATAIIALVTRYVDTTITNHETLDPLTNTTSTYASQIRRIPATQTIDCNVPIIPTQLIGLNDSRNEPNKPCMRLSVKYKNATYYGTRITSIFYVYSTLKIIQVPQATSANGLFQCTTKSEFLPCQPSITFDSNPYLGSYYLTQPIAATKLPDSLFGNAIGPAANADVHINTILTFPTPFTYLPSVGDRLEGLGYVPRSILDWMLQQDAYIGEASLLTSCSPWGPPLLGEINLVPSSSALFTAVSDLIGGINTVEGNVEGAVVTDTPVITDGLGEMSKAGPVMATPGNDLTVSTAVTVFSAGCFNPEAYPNIREPPALKAENASADSMSQLFEPAGPTTTVARPKADDATGTADRTLPLLFTFGGQIFTPHPARFSIEGTTISAGGSGVTIAGTLIRLEASGILKLGTSVASIASIASTTGHPWLATVSTEIFAPNPTASAITRTTISETGSIVTVSVTSTNWGRTGNPETGGSIPTLAPKSASKASNSRSGRNNNPVMKKRLGILFILYLICQTLAM